jgi:hypothetical protein
MPKSPCGGNPHRPPPTLIQAVGLWISTATIPVSG